MKFDVIEAALSSILISSGVAVVMPDAEARILCFSIIGAALGGLIAVETGNNAGNLTRRQKCTRWVTNLAGGIVLGPLLTDYLTDKLPNARPIYVALASGGVSGFAGVVVLAMAMPAFLKWISSKFQPPSKLP